MRYPDGAAFSADSTKTGGMAFFEVAVSRATLRDEGVMLVASVGMWFITCGLCVGTVTIYRILGGANNDCESRPDVQGPVEQHPLVNYLQHEGALSNPGRRSTLPCCMYLAPDGKCEPITIPVDGIEMGSISMLSVQVGYDKALTIA